MSHEGEFCLRVGTHAFGTGARAGICERVDCGFICQCTECVRERLHAVGPRFKPTPEVQSDE